ncbi:MAG: hypothetical protein PXY39_12675 [archaeon]|nr:hypothetical protein [archaeon]
MVFPTAVEFAISLDSANINGPSLLWMVWNALLVYVMGVIPFLLLYYLGNQGRKTVISYIVIEVALYTTFFGLILPSGLLPTPTNFSAIAWLNTPVVTLIVLVALTKLLSSSDSKLLEASHDVGKNNRTKEG